MPRLLLFAVIAQLIHLAVFAQTEHFTDIKSFARSLSDNPDWVSIGKNLNKEFNQRKADSLLMATKVEYYWQKKDYTVYTKEYIAYVQKYNFISSPDAKNNAAWRVFEYASDKEDLAIAERWIRKAQNAEPMNAYYLDTWASILYKLGEFKRAEEMETWAVWIGRMEPIFIENLFKIKAGLPTWKYPSSEQKEDRNKKSEDAIWLAIHKKLNRTTDSLIWQGRLIEGKKGLSKNDYSRTIIQYVEEFKPIRNSQNLNSDAWSIFQHSDNKNELKKALAWSNESVNDQKEAANYYAFMDTYANLLYKLGRQKEAIQWEEKAIALCPETSRVSYEATLAKMKKGEKTW